MNNKLDVHLNVVELENLQNMIYSLSDYLYLYKLKEKTFFRGCYFQEGNQVAIEMSVDEAYQRAMQTLFQWVHKEVNRSKTQVFFRTYAPTHFR